MLVGLLVLGAIAAVVGWIARLSGWRFALRRLAGLVLVVVAVTFATTALLRQVPGDPCATALGTATTDESLAACRADRGLDEGVVQQYGRWAGDVISGDLGPAQYRNDIALTEVLAQRAPRSLWLFAYSQLSALGLAVPLGVWSAYQADRPPRPMSRSRIGVAAALLVALGVAGGWSVPALVLAVGVVPVMVFNLARGGVAADRTVNAVAFALLALPVFVLGETLRWVFAIQRDWYDLAGYRPWSAGVGAHLASVWLPALVLGLAACPVYLRLLRADMVQNLREDYVAVARAKGLPDRHILVRHVLRPSTVTLLTVVGLSIGQMVNGAIVVEFIYDFDGIGSYLVEAVNARELFPVQTLVAMVAVLFVLANTVLDVAYTAVDPRVRAEALP